jgi:hypothetical protein
VAYLQRDYPQYLPRNRMAVEDNRMASSSML